MLQFKRIVDFCMVRNGLLSTRSTHRQWENDLCRDILGIRLFISQKYEGTALGCRNG